MINTFLRIPCAWVHGQVSPPTFDLANESLVASHIYEVWLNETRQKLSNSINHLLDMEKPEQLPLRQELVATMDNESVRKRSMHRVSGLIGMLASELNSVQAPWYREDWADRIVRGAFRTFDRSLDRWRELYLATRRQMNQAHQIQLNAAASERERQQAAQPYNEARTQQGLLLQSKPPMNSDFNTDRYLASQGFLPGYNFPRLLLLAFIPARSEKIGRDSFLSRPRFLALSEFGPLGVIYHEGSLYRVRKVIIGIRDEQETVGTGGLPVRHARICNRCGYGHFGERGELDRCQSCDAALSGGLYIANLYRVENVSTRRVTRITSDDEERLRQGYEMQTTFQFAEDQGRLQVVRTSLTEAAEELAEIQYGPTASVWRINLGWRRRKQKSIHGFNIDVTTGIWSRDEQAPQDEDASAESGGNSIQRVTPFAEDRRNVLILRPREAWKEQTFATLQYALKRGIESVF